jgi:hypothetical protein
MDNQSGVVDINSKATEVVNCKNGWGCHGRKSGKCPYSHPDNPLPKK